MTLRQICCWLTGHSWMIEWEIVRIPVLDWPIQRMKGMRCTDCGLEKGLREEEL